MNVPDICPQCGSDTGIKIVNTNGTEAGIDIYCEDCGWPDENFDDQDFGDGQYNI